MSHSLPILDGIRVASPCQASWEGMEGDDRRRACRACGKDVYNLSAMTTAEALALVGGAGPTPCVRFYQRADGTVLTSDCPVGVKTVRVRQARRAAGLGMVGLALISAVASALGLRRDLTPPSAQGVSLVGDDEISLTPAASVDVLGRVSGADPMPTSAAPDELILKMGEPTATTLPPLRPLMGRVARLPINHPPAVQAAPTPAPASPEQP